jgi:hypothetical protein
LIDSWRVGGAGLGTICRILGGIADEMLDPNRPECLTHSSTGCAGEGFGYERAWSRGG